MKAAPSILNRIVMLHLAAFVVMSAAIIVAAFLLLRATVNRFEESVLKAHAQTVSRHLSHDGDWKLSLPPELAADYRAGSGSFALAVISDSNRILTSSFPEPVQLPLALDIRSDGGFSYQRMGNSVFYRQLMPVRDGPHTAWIMVGQNLANPNVIVDDVLAGFSGPLIWSALPILALILLVDILVLRQQFRPVVSASRMAASVQPESVPARLPMLNLPREVLPLAEAFNQALERLEEALRAQREFTADAAHELRTPLAILRTEIEMNLDAEIAHRLHGDIDAMAHILDQLLELAELEGETLVAGTADLAAVASDVASLMAPLALTKGRILELSLPGPAPVIAHGNHHMLSRALRNLVENAIRHAPRTGHIEVKIQRPATIIVTDNGPGIPVSERSLVFQRFWRRKNDTAGNAGLGLAIVAKIVDLHGGKIEVADNPSGGAKFSLLLQSSNPPTS